MAKGATAVSPGDYYSPEGDVHTLTQAHKIKSDPKRHAAAKAHAKKQLDAMKAISSPMGGPTVEGKEKAKK